MECMGFCRRDPEYPTDTGIAFQQALQRGRGKVFEHGTLSYRLNFAIDVALSRQYVSPLSQDAAAGARALAWTGSLFPGLQAFTRQQAWVCVM